MRMAKRELTPEEKKLCEKQIRELKEENKWLNYIAKHAALMVSEGLWLNYQKQLKEYLKRKKDAYREIYQNERIIAVLKDQIENGVEIKENNDDENKNNKEEDE